MAKIGQIICVFHLGWITQRRQSRSTILHNSCHSRFESVFLKQSIVMSRCLVIKEHGMLHNCGLGTRLLGSILTLRSLSPSKTMTTLPSDTVLEIQVADIHASRLSSNQALVPLVYTSTAGGAVFVSLAMLK